MRVYVCVRVRAGVCVYVCVRMLWCNSAAARSRAWPPTAWALLDCACAGLCMGHLGGHAALAGHPAGHQRGGPGTGWEGGAARGVGRGAGGPWQAVGLQRAAPAVRERLGGPLPQVRALGAWAGQHPCECGQGSIATYVGSVATLLVRARMPSSWGVGGSVCGAAAPLSTADVGQGP